MKRFLSIFLGLLCGAHAATVVQISDAGALLGPTAAQLRTAAGLVIGTNVQAYDADLDTWATVTPSANGKSLVSSANYSGMRTLLGLAIGTDVLAPNGSGASLTGLPVPATITLANEAADTTCFILFGTAATGNLGPKTNTNITYDSSTGGATSGQLNLGSGGSLRSYLVNTDILEVGGIINLQNTVTGATPVALTGSVAVSGSNTTVTGTGTAFLSEVANGNLISINGTVRTVSSRTNDTTLVLTTPHPGTISAVRAAIVPAANIHVDVSGFIDVASLTGLNLNGGSGSINGAAGTAINFVSSGSAEMLATTGLTLSGATTTITGGAGGISLDGGAGGISFSGSVVSNALISGSANTLSNISGSSITGGTFGAVNGSALTALTAANITNSTMAGRAVLNLTNPSAISFVKIAADNTVSTRTPSQVVTDLSLTIGTNTQAHDAGLDSLAAAAGANTIYYRSGAGTWSAVTIGTGLTFAAGSLAPDGPNLTNLSGSNVSGGTFGAVNGSALTAITAANITGSHTLPDGVLSTNVPLLNAANTSTAAQTNSTAGAASTPVLKLSGAWLRSTASAVAQMLIQESGATAYNGSSVGCGLAINMDTGTGNFIDLQVDGTTKAKIDKDGTATVGLLISNSYIQAASGSPIQWNGASTLNTSTNGALKLANNSQGTGVTLDFITADTLKVKNLANNADAALTASSGTFSGSVTIGSGTVILKHLSASATLDFGSTAAGGVTDLTITVTGAALSDSVAIGIPNASVVAGGDFTAWVSATSTVTVRFSNNSLVTAYDPASGTFRADVWQH